MTALRIELPPKLCPVFAGRADVRWARGGRGSGKTRSFATMAAVVGMRFGLAGVSGQLLCARQFMNSLEESSLEEIKRAIESDPVLSDYYNIGDKFIKSHDGRIRFTFAGLDRNVDSIKSKGRLLLCWVDEAEPVTDGAWTKLLPTLREEGEGWTAELWVTWNPLRRNAPVEQRFARSTDPMVKGCAINFGDNPRFPSGLERQRQRDKRERPELYPHIWEGEFLEVAEGAYFAPHLVAAKDEGRITDLAVDPLMTIRLYVDIGGTGARADNFVIVVAQFVGERIRVLDCYEARGQPAATHMAWLRERGYTPGRAEVWLPHDGDQQDKVHDASYAKFFRDAGYTATVVPNQGKGAAKARIEAARRLFPSVSFDAGRTEGLRAALGWYHERRDEARGIGLGPEHDWASHASDAFGLMCICHEPPSASWGKPLNYRRTGLA